MDLLLLAGLVTVLLIEGAKRCLACVEQIEIPLHERRDLQVMDEDALEDEIRAAQADWNEFLTETGRLFQ